MLVDVLNGLDVVPHLNFLSPVFVWNFLLLLAPLLFDPLIDIEKSHLRLPLQILMFYPGKQGVWLIQLFPI